MNEALTRHKNILRAEDSLLLVVDVQERFRPHINSFDAMLGGVRTLVQAAEILKVPVVLSEQYTRGLGPTVGEIKSLENNEKPWARFEKNCFSAVGASGLKDHLQKEKRSQIVVCGIETHVCVSQSVHDLILHNYQVHVVSDAVASRAEINKKIGLKKMYAAGALPATVEMILFEWLVEAGTANFKQVQSLVK